MHVDYDEEFPAMSYEHYNWLCEMGDKILDGHQILNEFYTKLASKQKDNTPEFEKTFKKHYRKLLAKF